MQALLHPRGVQRWSERRERVTYFFLAANVFLYLKVQVLLWIFSGVIHFYITKQEKSWNCYAKPAYIYVRLGSNRNPLRRTHWIFEAFSIRGSVGQGELTHYSSRPERDVFALKPSKVEAPGVAYAEDAAKRTHVEHLVARLIIYSWDATFLWYIKRRRISSSTSA